MNFPSNEQIEQVDKVITSLLMNATKSVQGIKRNIPFLKEKEEVRAAKLFWKDYIKKIEGNRVDETKMNKRKQIAQIEVNELLIKEQANEKLKYKEERWNNLISFGKEIRENKILDYYYYELKN